MHNFTELCALLRERELERLIPHAGDLVAPSIRLLLEPWPPSPAFYNDYPTDETPLGYSKIGGLPDLPPDFVWPEGEKWALPFLAQIRLKEVSPHDLDGDLPASGFLTFFYDHDAHLMGEAPSEICRVFHIENDSNVKRRLFPDNLRPSEVLERLLLKRPTQHNGNFEIPLGMKFRRELQLADDDALEFEDVAQALALAAKERELWWRLSLDWSEQNAKESYLEIAKRKLEYQEQPYHQLLGFPYCGNYDGRAEVTGEGWETEAIHWRLLFQLSSDDDLGWGDSGIISFFIRYDALQNWNFEDVRVSYDG